MYNFIAKGQPPTYNSWRKIWTPLRKAAYTNAIGTIIAGYHPSITLLRDDLYGVIYHFFNTDMKIDADNLSKPMWDTLNSVFYSDDYQIKLRVAGSFDLKKNGLTVLDFTTLGGQLIADLLDAFDNEDHVIYVECGKLNFSHRRFNLE
ncbi:MAG: RusA family crossover junction endodeoxyribonuclease [Chryseobacterium sp.]|nr:MAG: RusA family crossover junction endodeoxyribonuclease [Chryseobacterium sp.]